MLDSLTAAGEVVWAGGGSLPGRDGWVSLHLSDGAPVTLPVVEETAEPDELQRAIMAALAPGGAYFFRQLSDAVGATDDDALSTAIWDLVWAGLLTNDTLTPLRMLTSGGGAHRRPARAARSRLYRGRAYARPALPARGGPPSLAGRWSLLPTREADVTVRAHALGETLLERYGVVTRGSVVAEGITGGFALAYKVLAGFEDTGRCRRGYFVETLGAAQFATPGAVDRLRAAVPDEADHHARVALALAATDPANPYGAALPWPAADAESLAGTGGTGTAAGTGTAGGADPERGAASGHRPGRKAGALVVLVDGALGLYLERGGKTLLAFTEDREDLEAAATALARLVRSGGVPKLTVETVNGRFVLGTALGEALSGAGFTAVPRGLTLRS